MKRENILEAPIANAIKKKLLARLAHETDHYAKHYEKAPKVDALGRILSILAPNYIDYVAALGGETIMRRYFDNGGRLATLDDWVVFADFECETSESFVDMQQALDRKWIAIFEYMSGLRVIGGELQEGRYVKNRVAVWGRVQLRYTYRHRMSDPLKEESPMDSVLWLRLMEDAALRAPNGLWMTYLLRELRRSGAARLLCVKGKVVMRANAGEESHYNAIRDIIMRDGLGDWLKEELKSLGMRGMANETRRPLCDEGTEARVGGNAGTA